MKKVYLAISLGLLLSPAILIGQSIPLINMDGFVQNYIDTAHKAGISACIIKGDTVYWKGSFGYANLEDSIVVCDTTLFNVMSISKTITATCLMMQWEDGYIDLDDNINEILPFQIDNPYQEPDSITPRQLMTHSSCIIDNNWLSYVSIGDPTIALGTFLEDYLVPGGSYYDSSNFSPQVPGSFPSYSYSNIGYGLNGYLVEVCDTLPTSYNSFVQTRIHEPLGMNLSAWYLDELNMNNLATGYSYNSGQYNSWGHYGLPFYPATSLRSNVNELSQYVIMMLNNGIYNGDTLLHAETIDSMFTVQLDFLYTGLGLRRDTVQCITGDKIQWGHKGGGAQGYSAEMQFCREENTAVLYLSNSSNYSPGLVQRMFEYAAMIVISLPPTNISSYDFTASWYSAPDAGGYLLDLAYDSEFTNYVSGYQNFNSGMDTCLQIEGLANDSTYYYRLRAYNEYDTGAYSKVFKVNLDINPGTKKLLPDELMIWSSNSTIYIDNNIPDDGLMDVNVYSLDCKLLYSGRITPGQNIIRTPFKNQIVVVAINNKKYKYSWKLLLK